MSLIPTKSESDKEAGAQTEKQIQLKKLRKKIRKIRNQRNQEIEEIKKNATIKHIPINIKAQHIIEGQNDVTTAEKAAAKTTSYQNQQKCVQNNHTNNQIQKYEEVEPVYNYWKKVIMSSHGPSLKQHDLDLLDYLQQMSVKEFSNERITLIFVFKSGHHIIPGGKYEKTIVMNEDGIPICYQGKIVSNSYKLNRCLMKLLLTSTTNSDHLLFLKQFFQLAAMEIIPKSLHYYLTTRYKQSNQISNTVTIQQEIMLEQHDSIYTRCSTH